ncbi:MAG: DUF2459 domain-containing protein [Gloeomargarita sp. SKYBB_i_bin120]|nr:DUF2459 domain-containing protein [Gloeomargarita sp. SKYG98]MCS7291482.1 DUF2459 domain-containing protein [Gloeomargarita sp. SKYB120]MDW8177042.1 DUF2459 domain-containing protein [Gloeomargarita sp. SKYBB_i_bin120]
MRRWLSVGGLAAFLALGSLMPRRWPVAQETPCPIAVYLVGDLLHSDLILPRQNPYFDWGQVLPLSTITPREPAYLSFGFGEQRFYMDAPAPLWQRWPDGVRALFWANAGIIYVNPVSRIPQHAQCLGLQPAQYRQLVAYIQQSFRRDAQGRVIPLGRGHHWTGQFFQAQATYSLLFTCNHWTADALDQVGVPMPWLPLLTASVRWHSRNACPCPQAASS